MKHCAVRLLTLGSVLCISLLEKFVVSKIRYYQKCKVSKIKESYNSHILRNKILILYSRVASEFSFNPTTNFPSSSAFTVQN